MWGGVLGYEFRTADFQALLEVTTKCLPRMQPVPPSPPPPAPATGACARVCGEGTCQRFSQTSCAAVEAALPSCNCAGCCQPTPFTPAKVHLPPPTPRRPPPPPAACNAPCLGTTCGAFSGTSCSDFRSALGCDCSGCCVGDAGNLRCVLDKWPAGLPNLFPFTGGESGRTIVDGGGDMYDSGNELSVRIGNEWRMQLPYTQDCDGLFPSALLDGRASYSTCKLTGGSHTADGVGDQTAGTLFAAAITSPSSEITGFAVTGNLGADGGGHRQYFNVTGPRGVRGYFKQVYGAQSDASVNHLILSRSPITGRIPTLTTDSDWHEVVFTQGQPAVYYLLWAGHTPSVIPGLASGSTGYRYTKEQVEALVNAVASSCFGEAKGFPPMPPPPASLGPAPSACSNKCGHTTCLAFRTTLCSTISQPPWSCSCGDCCAEATPPPPPSPPPSPPKPPPPAAPQQCDVPCAGSTCGAFLPYACSEFRAVLGCDCSGCCDTPLDVTCVRHAWPVELPSLYSFTEGYAGSSIRDGGSDMFDTGNELRVRIGTRWSSPLRYTQVCDGSSSASVQGLGDAHYVTCKHTDVYVPGYGSFFVAAIESRSGSITALMVNGNLGADGKGAQRANNGTDGGHLRGAHGAVGYYKQTFWAGSDASVNHLIFAVGDHAVGANVRVGNTTDSDLHELSFGRSGVPLVYYLLWGGQHGYRYEEEDFQKVLDAVAGACLPESGYVPPAGGGGGGRGGGAGASGGGGGVFGVVIFVLFLLSLVGFLGYGKYKGWRYPRLLEALDRVRSLKLPVPAMRSQTTPTPNFVNVAGGPLSTANVTGASAPLAMADSATPYVASPMGQTPYTPPPSSTI